MMTVVEKLESGRNRMPAAAPESVALASRGKQLRPLSSGSAEGVA
jgi:hypothetical protein